MSAHPLPFGNRPNHFSVEHIYPQTPNVGPQWTADLRAWRANRDDMDARRYVLGNLTAVTGFDNRRNGKKPFAAKKTLIQATARLKLHDSFMTLTQWKPKAIDKRTKTLASAALLRWPRP